MPTADLLGSFDRQTSDPLESNYIFNTKNELDAWASNSQLILHDGLIKTVSNHNGDCVLFSCYKNSLDNKFYFKLVSEISLWKEL